MIYDFIAIGIIIVCIGVIVYLLSRKFPVIAAINTSVLQKHKQEKVKQDIIEHRLKRKLSVFNFKKVMTQENGETEKPPFWQNIYKNLKDLEEKYRHKIKILEPEEQQEAEKSKNFVQTEAENLYKQEKYKEAESKFIEAISLDPKNTEAYEGLADVYIATKDYQHAKEIFHYLLKINKANPVAYQHLGEIAREEGNLQEAEKDYLQSISLNNEVAGYHIDLGKIYMAMGDHERALHSYLEAIKLEPNNPRHLDLVIETALRLNKKEIAGEYIEKLKAANPANEKLAEFTQALKEL